MTRTAAHPTAEQLAAFGLGRLPPKEQAEIDEPEEVAAPVLPQKLRPILGRDDPTIDAVVDGMTEEELLRGLEKLPPEDPSTNLRNTI